MTQYPQIVFEEKCEKHLTKQAPTQAVFSELHVLLITCFAVIFMLKILIKLDALLYSIMTT